MSTAEEAEKINAASADPVPAIQPSLDSEIKLFRGIHDTEAGEWYDIANLRELNGADEEVLAALQQKKDATFFDYSSKVLELGIESIGPYKPSKLPGLVNKLILPDREMVFLGLVRLTYGLEREINVRCRKCDGLNDVVINLDDDIPVIEPDFDVQQPILVNLPKGKHIHVRIPNGEDTLESQKGTKNDAEVTSKLISRIAIFDDGDEPPDRVAWSKSLSIADRREIAKVLVSLEMGPKMEEVNTQCAHCGAELPVVLDWVSLLFG